jgi:hypothetical protein
VLNRIRSKIREERALAEERQLEPGDNLAARLDRIQRAFDTEQASGASLNMRGSALALGSALAILLVAQFSAAWLDDNSWVFPGHWSTVQHVLLLISVAALVLCLLVAVVVVWPRRHWGSQMRRRVKLLADGGTNEEAELLLRMLEIQRAVNERKSIGLRVAAIPLALAVIAVVGQSAVFALKANPVDRSACTSRAGDARKPVQDALPPLAVQKQLAAQYAPRVYVHPNEPYGPLPVSDFLEASQLVWNSPRGDDQLSDKGAIEASRLGVDCEHLSDGCYEHNGCVADQVTRPSETGASRAPGLNPNRGVAIDPDGSVRRPSPPGNPQVPVFYEFRRANGEAIRITYWFFYGYSRPNARLDTEILQVASHEGDWESIDVKLVAANADYVPIRVLYFAHGREPTTLDWGQATVVRDGAETVGAPQGPGHPVVFSAIYDHASYPGEGSQPALDVTKRGPVVWDTWLSGVKRVVAQPWYGFGGAWGAGGGRKGEIGPLGPSPWKQSSDPDPDNSALAHRVP